MLVEKNNKMCFFGLENKMEIGDSAGESKDHQLENGWHFFWWKKLLVSPPQLIESTFWNEKA